MKTATEQPAIADDDAFLKKVEKIATLEGDLNAAIASLNNELNEVRKKHEPGIDRLTKRLDAWIAEAKAYAEGSKENRERLFAAAKTLTTKTGKAAIRKTSSVGLLSKVTEDKAIADLKAAGLADQFVKVKESLDKPALKKALEGDDADLIAKIKKAGLRVLEKFSLTVTAKKD